MALQSFLCIKEGCWLGIESEPNYYDEVDKRDWLEDQIQKIQVPFKSARRRQDGHMHQN